MNKITEYNFGPIGSFIDCNELSRLTSISVERIHELVGLLAIPHLRIDGGPPLFRKAKAVEWIKKNLVHEYEGQSLPTCFIVNSLERVEQDEVPIALLPMREKLFEGVCKTGFNPPCVYFLMFQGSIMYVGKSVNLPIRLHEHRASRKIWDRVLWIPCQENQLSDVEQWWIRHIKPPLNGDYEIKRHEINPPKGLIAVEP